MTTETCVFLLTLLLGFAHILTPAVFKIARHGVGTLAGPRDGLEEPDSLYYHRGVRANNNFRETAPWALGLSSE